MYGLESKFSCKMGKSKTTSQPQPAPTKSSGDGPVGVVREQQKKRILYRLVLLFAFIFVYSGSHILTHSFGAKVEMGQKKAPTLR